MPAQRAEQGSDSGCLSLTSSPSNQEYLISPVMKLQGTKQMEWHSATGTFTAAAHDTDTLPQG